MFICIVQHFCSIQTLLGKSAFLKQSRMLMSIFLLLLHVKLTLCLEASFALIPGGQNVSAQSFQNVREYYVQLL